MIFTAAYNKAAVSNNIFLVEKMDDARPGLNIMDNNETLSDQNCFYYELSTARLQSSTGEVKMIQSV